jgi:hypothetical protein
MEPEDALLCPQEQATGPYLELGEASPHPRNVFLIHFNIILIKEQIFIKSSLMQLSQSLTSYIVYFDMFRKIMFPSSGLFCCIRM